MTPDVEHTSAVEKVVALDKKERLLGAALSL
jgi:hypothetical protein